MPATFCVPKNISDQIKEAMRGGQITAKNLYAMTSKERSDLFSRYMGTDGGTEIASRFEDEMIARQKTGILSWIDRQTEGKEYEKQAYDAVEKFQDNGVINPVGAGLKAAVKSIAEQRNGIGFTGEEMSGITERAKNLEAIKDTTPAGTPFPKDYYTAKSDLNNYIYSIAPDSTGKSLASLSKDNILFSLPSAAKNALGNFESDITGRVARRGSNLIDAVIKKDSTEAVVSTMNRDVSNSWKKETMQIYHETGINRGLTSDLDKTWGTGDTKRAVTGDGGIAKVSRFVNDTIMKYLHGEAHVASYADTMGDVVNLEAKKIALKQGFGDDATTSEFHKQLMTDAFSENPSSNDAKVIREKAQEQAAYYANINDSEYAQSTRLMKAAIQKVAGKTTADWLMPIVKAPANIVGKSIDYAGAGLIKAAVSGTQQILAGETEDGIGQIVKAAGATGVAYTMAAMVVQAIGANNFQGIPANQAETDLMNERGAKPFSVKIGSNWVSLTAFLYLAPEIAGMFKAEQARAQGKGLGQAASAAVEGAAQTIANDFPGVNTLTRYVEQSQGQNGGLEAAGQDFVSTIYSRLTPGSSVLGAIARTTDPMQRTTKGQGAGAYVEAEIPGLRENLPVKESESGTPLPNNPLRQLLTGSYTSADQSNPVTNELTRLASKGYGADLVTPESEPRFKTLLSEKGQATYDQAVDQYYTQLNSEISAAIASPSYSTLTIDKKKALLEQKHTDVLDSIMSQYGYVTPQTVAVSEY